MKKEYHYFYCVEFNGVYSQGKLNGTLVTEEKVNVYNFKKIATSIERDVKAEVKKRKNEVVQECVILSFSLLSEEEKEE